MPSLRPPRRLVSDRSAAGGGAAFAVSVASSTCGLGLVVDASQLALGDADSPAGGCGSRASGSVASHSFDLVVGPVFAGVGARVAAVPVGLGLDQRGPPPVAGAVEHAQRGEVDGVDVVAVDEDALEPVRRSRGPRPDARRPSPRRSACTPCTGCSRRRTRPAASRPRRSSAPRGTPRCSSSPSPKNATATCPVPRCCADHAAPSAIVRCAPTIA